MTCHLPLFPEARQTLRIPIVYPNWSYTFSIYALRQMISPSMLGSQPRYFYMQPWGTYHTPTPKRRRHAGKTYFIYKAD